MTEGCMPVPDAVVTIRDLEVRPYAHYIGISTGDSATMLDRDAVTLLINVLDYKMTQWMKMDRMEEMSAMIPRAGIVECSHDD